MPSVAEIQGIADPVVTITTKARMASEPGIGSMLSFGLGRSSTDDAVTHNLVQIETAARAWRDRGLAAAKAGTVPGGGGWQGWRTAGQVYVDGAADQLREQKWLLPAITETVAKIPEHAKADVTKAAAVVGDVAAGAASGFLTKAWWVVGLVIVGAVGYLYMQKKLIRG